MADARSLAAVLCEELTSDELDILREDPIEAIPLIDERVSIRLVAYEPGEGCSVEGLYHETSRSIVVQRAASARRTRFTAIHEFGHDRARHNRQVAGYLASLKTTTRTTEERIADAFAAAVLIPDAALDDILGGKVPQAHHLVELFHRDGVSGSREACCVRIAQRMRGAGYVVLCEGDRLRFCATVGASYPIARGASQAGVGLLRRAIEHGSATDPNARLQFPDGRFTAELAGHAVTDDIYTFAILTDSTSPPWGGWIPPRRSQGEAPEIFCTDCDEVTEAWKRCEVDGRHRVCSSCGWCECRAPRVKVAEQVCDVCTLHRRVDLFEPGSTICKDCT